MTMNMSRFMASLAVAAAAACAAAPGAVVAQTAGVASAGLYRALGEKAGVATLAADVTRRLAAEPRTAPFFKETDLVRFESQLALQLCEVSGGGCSYQGKDMKTVHSGVDITKADFNAVVEILQQSMDSQRIAFPVQNRLLARLAPMHREIVNVPTPGAADVSTAARRAAP